LIAPALVDVVIELAETGDSPLARRFGLHTALHKETAQ